MKESLQKQLFLRFPDIFSGRKKSVQESAMPFGIGCGDGWFQIIWDLSVEIERYSKEKDIDIAATQVKEKMGSLRFYTNLDSDDHVYELIEKAANSKKHT